MVTVRTGPEGDQRVRLDTRLYVPSVATAARPAPAVLLAHGFGGTKTSVDAQARDLAGRGYVVLAWTAQGFGRSGGQVHLNSPDYEVADASRLLDRLAARPEVRRDAPGDPRVGVVGSSYGGALALLLAGHDPRVDAIVPQSTWNDLGRSLFPESTGKGPEDGVFKRVWAGWLYAAGLGGGGSLPALSPGAGNESLTEPGSLVALTNPSGAGEKPRTGAGSTPESVGPRDERAGCGRFAVAVCRMYQRVATSGRADPATSALLARSSPAGVLDRITAPTLMVHGTADTLFPLAEANANALGIAADRTPVRVMWFSGGHDAGAGSDLDRSRVRKGTLDWLDHYLRGTGPAPRKSFPFSRVSGVDYGGNSVRTVGLFAPAGYPRLDGDAPAREVPLVGAPRLISNPPAGTPAAVSSVPGLGALDQDPADARHARHPRPVRVVRLGSAGRAGRRHGSADGARPGRVALGQRRALREAVRRGVERRRRPARRERRAGPVDGSAGHARPGPSGHRDAAGDGAPVPVGSPGAGHYRDGGPVVRRPGGAGRVSRRSRRRGWHGPCGGRPWLCGRRGWRHGRACGSRRSRPRARVVPRVPGR